MMMESKWFWILLTVLLLEGFMSNGCLKHERIALLQLKSFFNHPRYLSNWVDVKGSDCCQWESVECSNTSRRVIQLSLFLPFEELKSLYLYDNPIAGFVDNKGFAKQSSVLDNLEILDLSFNYLDDSILSSLSGLSSLQTLNLGSNQLKGSLDMQELNTLTNLRKLDLSYNNIESFHFSQDSERQLKLMNLEELDLSDNLFNVSILAQLSGLFNLKSLNLRYNQLKGSIMKGLQVLKNLEELDFSYNELYEFLASNEIGSLRKLRVAKLEGVFVDRSVSLLEVVNAFSSVKTLYLGHNYLNKTISTQELNLSSNVQELFLDSSYLSNDFFESVGVLTSLKKLILSNCGLAGTLPTKDWWALRKLEYLDPSNNAFEGTFPSCLNNLTYLRILDVSHNHFEIPASFMSFANHSHLKFLFIDGNNLVGESTFQTWTPIPKLQLQVLSMLNCTPEELPRKLPNFLYYQYDLRYLNLSYNNFAGKLPFWLLENNTRLQQVFFIGNSFRGCLQLPKHTNVNMVDIGMSRNKIEGQIPMNICSTFPNLGALSLFQNAFEGNIPPCLGRLKSLWTLDLSYNNLSGGIPKEIAKSISLADLRLSKNNLSGKLVPTIFSSNALHELYLDGNNFDGEIPLIDNSTFGFPDYSELDLSNNHLSGRLPKWIGYLSNLETLDLSKNHLDGVIPSEFCNLDGLEFLDLSQNNLSGSLPSCFNPPHIQHVHLRGNRLSGPLPHALYKSSSLVTLDLSQNKLTGKIPNWIGTLSALSILLLKANHLEGKIPSQLCRLNSLSIIDLSHNKLFGSIPSCLSVLTFGPSNSMSFSVGLIFCYGPQFEQLGDFEGGIYPSNYVEVQVEFMTKKGLYTYSGDILEYMSGIDLSCNRLTGQIPPGMGNLSQLHALNLSHNNLTGFIPSTFSNLRQIESLDLSNNNLSGKIPIQLMELNYLEVFNVSYNNLSGIIPYKAQFATFDDSSYLQNSFLCGPPVHKNCTKSDPSPTIPDAAGGEEEGGLVDDFVFLVSFLVSYGMVLLVIASVLYINPYWRQAWFYFIEQCITACHYFIVDHFPMLSMFRRSW
ncbi:hypothetical protein PTKIN_Ptkin19aG0075900 [Pterospermum kingtungense]